MPTDRDQARHPRRAFGARAGGLTLAELVIALVISSITAAAVATMLFSVSAGTASRSETRGFLVCHATAAARLSEAVRSAKMVLAKGEDYLVLWHAESPPDGMVNLSEIQRIERDPVTRELRSYRAPADLAEAADTGYPLGATDFNAVTNAVKGTAGFPRTLWATDVTGWTTALDAQEPQQAGFVSYRITVTLDGVSETTAGGAAMRNQ